MQAARLALKERAGGDAPYPDLWGFVEIGELARILDWKGGLSRVRIRGCLDRLAEVRVLSSTPTARWWNDLLSTYENKVTGRLVVQVDPTLARAVLFPTQQHVNYSMAERRELRSTGKVAHVWLSSWLQPAHQKTIHLETLYDHVWPDEDVAPSTHRSRRARLVQALEELRGVGWTITEEKGKPLVIRRPAAPRRVGSRHPTPGAFRPAVPQSVFNPNPYITIEEYEARSSATAWTPSARV